MSSASLLMGILKGAAVGAVLWGGAIVAEQVIARVAPTSGMDAAHVKLAVVMGAVGALAVDVYRL